jgi:hypothetical protein
MLFFRFDFPIQTVSFGLDDNDLLIAKREGKNCSKDYDHFQESIQLSFHTLKSLPSRSLMLFVSFPVQTAQIQTKIFSDSLNRLRSACYPALSTNHPAAAQQS